MPMLAAYDNHQTKLKKKVENMEDVILQARAVYADILEGGSFPSPPFVRTPEILSSQQSKINTNKIRNRSNKSVINFMSILATIIT